MTSGWLPEKKPVEPKVERSYITTCELTMQSLSDLMLATLVLYLNSFVSAAEGSELKCACTTRDCVLRGLTTCTTSTMCFTQFLDHEDGSHALLRGCIDTKTPLLCENMRPAVPGNKWPVLVCCDDRDACNDRVVPTPPAYYFRAKEEGKTNASLGIAVVSSGGESGGVASQLSAPLYVSVLVVGLVLLLLLGLAAVCLLGGQRRFYGKRWTVGRTRKGYEKGRGTDLPDAADVA